MERRAFGNTALEVPVIGMGTWKTFDVRGKEADARVRVTDAAFETGATFFDSSPMYGEAEQQIDHALSCFGGRLDVYQVHNIVAWRKRLEQLQRLKEEGAAGAAPSLRSAAKPL